jgi:hypothetical protein
MEKPKESRLKPEFKVAEAVNPMKTMESNVIIQKLEENLKLREMPIEKQIRKNLLR